jgi:hypothetical protein
LLSYHPVTITISTDYSALTNQGQGSAQVWLQNLKTWSLVYPACAHHHHQQQHHYTPWSGQHATVQHLAAHKGTSKDLAGQQPLHARTTADRHPIS